MMREIKEMNNGIEMNGTGKTGNVQKGSSRQKMTTETITLIAMMTALTCVLAPLSIPIGPIPISLTNLVIYFGLYILGAKKETLSYIVYILIGLVGVPVFSGFTGGPGKLIGPTGGYIIGFIPMAVLAGIGIEKAKGKFVPGMFAMAAGSVVYFILGTLWLSYQGQMDFMTALFAGVIPFIPGDLMKMALAAFFGPRIQRQLKRVGLD